MSCHARAAGTHLRLNPSDLYSIIHYGPLLPTEHAEAASYEPVKGHYLDRASTVDDICDFVVEYLNSDVLVRTLHTPIARCHGLPLGHRVCSQTGT